GLLQTFKRARLTVFSERRERLALGTFLPPGRDREDTLVQALALSAVEAEPPQQHNARPALLARQRRHAPEVGLEPLADEALEQSAHQPMLDMELDGVGVIAILAVDRGLEGDPAHGRVVAPVSQAFSASGAALAQFVEQAGPSGVARKGRCSGIESEGF